MPRKNNVLPSHIPALLAIIVALAIALFLFRLTAPTDLMDFGQELPTAYTIAVVHNWHWLVQWDNNGFIASKPPLHTWLAAISSLTFGGVSK